MINNIKLFPLEVFCLDILYKCRHCKQLLGILNQNMTDTSVLGWQSLTHEEENEIIKYKANGDMEINVICEDCQEILAQNPSYHALDSFIQ